MRSWVQAGAEGAWGAWGSEAGLHVTSIPGLRGARQLLAVGVGASPLTQRRGLALRRQGGEGILPAFPCQSAFTGGAAGGPPCFAFAFWDSRCPRGHRLPFVVTGGGSGALALGQALRWLATHSLVSCPEPGPTVGASRVNLLLSPATDWNGERPQGFWSQLLVRGRHSCPLALSSVKLLIWKPCCGTGVLRVDGLPCAATDRVSLSLAQTARAAWTLFALSVLGAETLLCQLREPPPTCAVVTSAPLQASGLEVKACQALIPELWEDSCRVSAGKPSFRNIPWGQVAGWFCSITFPLRGWAENRLVSESAYTAGSSGRCGRGVWRGFVGRVAGFGVVPPRVEGRHLAKFRAEEEVFSVEYPGACPSPFRLLKQDAVDGVAYEQQTFISTVLEPGRTSLYGLTSHSWRLNPHDLVASPNPHLLIPSPWGLDWVDWRVGVGKWAGRRNVSWGAHVALAVAMTTDLQCRQVPCRAGEGEGGNMDWLTAEPVTLVGKGQGKAGRRGVASFTLRGGWVRHFHHLQGFPCAPSSHPHPHPRLTDLLLSA
ncbi:hypothetical protein Cadr_000016411 [Camelus dromedarius]|uniref:Uncharacterized protein n=1 Tax=Camelus dromedarius TaxID=9838 RepID=A0A5N4E9E3_CAMDR|nr:hypothetical protein Cadr_000016411 [Camelus dromedarius]